MTNEDKQRIEKEAFELSEYASHYALYNSGIKDGYVAGATAELERSEKLLQEYKEVIKELLPIAEQMEKMPMQQYHFIKEFTRTEVGAAIQKAKSLIEPKTDKA